MAFCGDSKGYSLYLLYWCKSTNTDAAHLDVGSGITMQSVPMHSEVVEFAQALVSAINKVAGLADLYEVACEHAHSCCVLVAHVRYKIAGVWCTHIDYEVLSLLALLVQMCKY